MDCNSYSYVNTRGKSNVIAETETGLSGWPVSFEICENYFGEWFYYVSDLFGSCGEYPLTCYASAARFYNSLVSDADAIPLF